MESEVENIKIDGMSYSNVRFNLYAFHKDLRHAESKRKAARSEKMKLHWDDKAMDAIQSLHYNTVRMAAFHIATGDCCITKLRNLECY